MITITTTITGNHEYSSGESWQSYQARYSQQFSGSGTSPISGSGQVSDPVSRDSGGSGNICYWGKVVGPTHIIALCSYAGITETSPQYIWLTKYLSHNIDRIRTPWVRTNIYL